MAGPILNQPLERIAGVAIIQNIDDAGEGLPSVDSLPPIEALRETLPYTIVITRTMESKFHIPSMNSSSPAFVVYVDGTHLPTLNLITSYFSYEMLYQGRHALLYLPQAPNGYYGYGRGTHTANFSLLFTFIKSVCGYTLVSCGDVIIFERHTRFKD